ncbi:MAG: hypothetical protein KIS66_11925 [Fimbriimonadaceae bacterium]|nr:hypothetical protein [Fimbriimonadaceae bacterium]
MLVNARKLKSYALIAAIAPTAALAQVPDLLTALDAGGRGMGMGGGVNMTGSDTLAAYYNPAGLGFVDSPRVGLAFRNLPQSTTRVSGNFSTPIMTSEGGRGANTMSHAGVAFPMGGKSEGPRRVLAVAYTLGGYLFDRQQGTNLTNGALLVRNYKKDLRLRTDYFTVAYAQANRDQSFNWGVGLNYVRQAVTKDIAGQLVDNTNNVVGNIDSRNSETGNGLGATLGVQFSPKGSGNATVGLSYRTEVNLRNNTNTAAVYDTIPARLAGGITFRRDGLRGGRDFLLFGGQIQHFFSGKNGSDFDRGTQTVFGGGFEYNYFRGATRIPFRVGYAFVPKSSSDFLSRNGFNLGVGYEPASGNYGLDLNMGFPERGGFDLGLSVSYRIGK